METDNKQVSPADIERAKNNDIMANKILTDSEKRLEDSKVTQEPVLVTEATKGILERQGITNVITQEELDARDKNSDNDDSKAKVINTIKQSTEKSASDEQQQVEKAEVNNESTENIDLSEEEFGALERAGITEEQILDSDGTFTQIKELAQTQLKKEQEASGASTEVDKSKASQDLSSMVISEEYATELALTYPFAKSLVGKTMEDAMKIISKQNQHITKLENSTGTDENKSDVDKTNSQNDNSGLDLSQDEVIDLLNLSPADATKKIAELMKKTAQTVTAEEVAKEVKKLLPNLEGLQQQSNDQYEKQFYTALADQLPEGADPEKVTIEWKKVNASMPNKSKQSLADNVELLITTIADSYKLGKLSKENTALVDNQNSEVKKQTYSKLKELIVKSKKLGVHNGQFNFKRKEMIDITGEPKDATESLLDPIIKRNLNRH